jgi:hypothetical protein
MSLKGCRRRLDNSRRRGGDSKAVGGVVERQDKPEVVLKKFEAEEKWNDGKVS